MTTIFALKPKSELKKRDKTSGLTMGFTIEVDADPKWDAVGLNFCGTPVIGVGLSSDDIDKLINALRQGQRMMKK